MAKGILGLLKRERNGFAACAFWMVVLVSMTFGSRAVAQAVPGLAATRVASGMTQPLFVTAPPGDYDRLFIVCQTGQVYVLKLATGVLNATPFLNIQSRLTATNGEQGLLGLAFDPNYATNGKFYLNFTAPGGFWGNGTTQRFAISGFGEF